jgi:hypothetical protein
MRDNMAGNGHRNRVGRFWAAPVVREPYRWTNHVASPINTSPFKVNGNQLDAARAKSP